MADLSSIALSASSEVPIYRQLADSVRRLIATGLLGSGDRLPPTRELAGQLGLNRTTISAAYAVLEEAGLIEGQVGRGSFVTSAGDTSRPSFDWDTVLASADPPLASQAAEISFANSRPAESEFPVDTFRTLAKQVIDGPHAPEILQLGSPHGYAPLRRFLQREAEREGTFRPGDDLIITNGCQQALDLLARIFGNTPHTVAIEDPVYHGLLRVFSRAGARLLPLPVDHSGLDVDALEDALRTQSVQALVVCPSFQNPTGATLSLERRKRVVALAQRHKLVLIENDIYSELRYSGKPVPTLKQLDTTGQTILLRSYSKVSFPGLRVGWVIAPQPVISRLAEAKQISDLHSDQLSQAVLLRFAESGELSKHLARTRIAGAARLEAATHACARYLPHGTSWTRPQGGMSLWVELPTPLNADALLSRAAERGVSFLPGRYFSIHNAHPRAFRISFGGLAPEQITRGISILGDIARQELSTRVSHADFEPVPALV